MRTHRHRRLLSLLRGSLDLYENAFSLKTPLPMFAPSLSW
jgi:hypothetical protein